MQLREKNENQDSYLERHQNVITSFLHNPHAGKPPTPRLNNSHKFFIFQTGFGGTFCDLLVLVKSLCICNGFGSCKINRQSGTMSAILELTTPGAVEQHSAGREHVNCHNRRIQNFLMVPERTSCDSCNFSLTTS